MDHIPFSPAGLGKCPDCEREVSLKAEHCPHCGRFFRAERLSPAFPDRIVIDRTYWVSTIAYGVLLGSILTAILGAVALFILFGLFLAGTTPSLPSR